MKPFLSRAFTDRSTNRRGIRRRRNWQQPLILLSLLCCALFLGIAPNLVHAQSDTPASDTPAAEPQPSPSTETLRESTVNERKDRTSPDSTATTPNTTPELKPPAVGKQYVLEFNRSPVVGTRFSLRGIYDEARLGFTRPRDWQIKSVKAQIRYRHSPALYATRSNLTVLLNGASMGSIPLNRKQGEVGSAVFDIPLSALQNYNEVTIGALQNNSPTCTQDPYDPSLWTEVMPDSKIVFNYNPQPVSLDFKNFPYPIFDELSLEPNRLVYLLPSKVDQPWLTSTTRLQSTIGRLADYRRLDTRLIKNLNEVKLTERLAIIGTPEQQPALKNLKLPMSLADNKILDSNKKPLPPEVGVLMLTTASESKVPVLIATGNGPIGVGKAVQFLVQTKDRKIGTGQSVIVKDLTLVPTPPPREWQGYLPLLDTFTLKDLTNRKSERYQDISVRGSDSPPIEVEFRALPDDKLLPGNTMNLSYSYGPQINPKTSLIEVKLDGVALIGKRLSSIDGENKQTLKIALPETLIKPTSKIQVDFRLDARERRSCSRVTDQQLWGTLHTDTSFNIKRSNAFSLPDLKLLQYGFPFAAPQDLSSTAIVLPKEPTVGDLTTLLEFAARLGRLSKANSVQLSVYTIDSFPKDLRDKRHLVAIGTQKTFPFPEALTVGDFALRDLARQRVKSEIQPSPDNDGVVKEIISPWNKERVLLALTSQTEQGLEQVQSLLRQDPLFFQIKEDTVLVSANSPKPEVSDPNAYSLEFLQREQKREIDKTPVPNRVFQLVSGSWFLLGPAIVAATLLLYGVVQLYLKRVAG
jgi:cellulose synthase operon protein B